MESHKFAAEAGHIADWFLRQTPRVQAHVVAVFVLPAIFATVEVHGSGETPAQLWPNILDHVRAAHPGEVVP